MTSHIDCDDLLALAAQCSVDDQRNADLRNQLSMSLLCHIAQASTNNTHGYGPIAPATTPTASSFQNSSSNAWISEDSFYSNPHAIRRTRESSVARAQSRFARTEDSEVQDDGDNMQIEQDDMQITALSTDSSRVIGKQPDASEPVSLFATSDPFYLAVQELQQASRCRRQLQPKPFSVNAPLQVTPNPVQFGTLNNGTQFGMQATHSHHGHGHGQSFGQRQHFGMAMGSSHANGYDPLERRAMPMDASLMQYR